MTDKDIQSYFKQRLSDYQTPDVPDFDNFFSEEELRPLRPKLRLWPWFTAAASVAAVLAFLLVFPWSNIDETTTESPVLAVNESSSVVQDQVMDKPLPPSEEFLSVEDAFDADASLSSTEVLYATAALSSSEDLPSEEPSSAQPVLSSSSLTSSEVEAVASESSATVYERSIEEAYAEARRQKAASRKAKRRVSYGFSFSQNNGLLASTSPMNQNSAMNGSPLMAASSHYASVSLRSTVSKNEWKVPENLSAGQLNAYTPIFHYPMTFGFSLEIPLSELLSIQTGLTYTYLFSEIHGNQEDASRWTLDQSLHYVGIPLQLAIDIVNHRSWRLYAGLGGGLEKGICGVQQSVLRHSHTDEVSTASTIQSVYGIQPYTSASFGLSYTFASRWQLYLQPAVNYYLDADQPMSIRTKKPLSLNLSAGIRFSL